jgi:hypothetical protein
MAEYHPLMLGVSNLSPFCIRPSCNQ